MRYVLDEIEAGDRVVALAPIPPMIFDLAREGLEAVLIARDAPGMGRDLEPVVIEAGLVERDPEVPVTAPDVEDAALP